MAEVKEILANLDKINERLGKLYKLQGNLDSLRLFEVTIEMLIENYYSLTKKDLEEVLLFIKEEKEKKHNKMIEISSK